MEIEGFDIQVIEYGSPEYDESVKLRHDILRKPLKMEFTEDQLAMEHGEVHVAAYLRDGLMVGCLILKKISEDALKMRQVAVAESHQRLGVGRAMVRFCEAFAIFHKFKCIQLNARQTAVDFYLKLNYNIKGQPFEEVGIPHRLMEKMIQ